MRSSKSRSRSKSNRNRSVGNIVNRVFDSSGPEGKVRGTPQQIIDKYLTLARDAQLANDRVAAENFQQHAEHYARMLSEAQREQQREADQRREREESQRRDRDDDQGSGGQHDNRDQNSGGGSDHRDRNDQPSQQDRGDRKPRQDDDRQPAAAENGVSEVVDLGDGSDSGLVETPESKPKRRTRRKPAASGDEQGSEDQQQAAE